jgi:hypothetical protein
VPCTTSGVIHTNQNRGPAAGAQATQGTVWLASHSERHALRLTRKGEDTRGDADDGQGGCYQALCTGSCARPSGSMGCAERRREEPFLFAVVSRHQM